MRTVLVVALIVPLLCAQAHAERGRLFRLERPGVPASHVFGTLHSDDARVAALRPELEAALAASRSAAFESLLGDGDVQAFFEQAQYADGRRLTDDVDSATLDAIRAALGTAAPDPATLARVKPWGVLLMLAQPQPSGATTLDALLKQEAARRRLVAFGLELPEEQVASLDAIPHASQLALMRWALATRDDRAADLEATTSAWLDGDLPRLRALALAPARRDPALAPHFDALMRHLIANRNALFAHRLHLPLARGRVFVAVGALHLDGRDGLLALLRRQGYRVTRVFRGRGQGAAR
jgi:uncharacterized protein YbaP (TraB family)